MGKKRTRPADADPAVDKLDADADSSSDDDMEIINVDFELFNYDATIDFHGVKSLLRQLFDADASLLDLSGLADAVVDQNTIGSTCKVDDKANDAYAFLTVLNASAAPTDGPVAKLASYLAERARSSDDRALAEAAPALLSGSGEGGPVVGLVLAERLLNMPAEVIPPMWGCLMDEVEAAVEDGEAYGFTHYVVVSRGYYEVASALDGPKVKRAREAPGPGVLRYFHPEDEEVRKHAAAAGTYAFVKEDEVNADSKRAFQEMGLKSVGFMMVIEAAAFKGAVDAMRAFVGSVV
ncbi:p21-C-terminal region-binding protein-domain-containing protein [Schizothecium vesticola]|uniref:Protein BCP1 n=1 Tax=Schizothecium vesticola TaxID=314040 RepID=A0AA40EWG0_9PEZI|nr:p21-C-terminal region-binding protein-domain-containing protein [Schizothecium vesticola]